jgi:2-deoxy-D-gluconate 3-dehydrogenase
MPVTGDLFDLTDRTAVVTGAARGLGLAASTVLAAHGAKVVLLDLLDPQVGEAAEKLRATGATAVAVPGDVTVDADLDRLRAAAEQVGPVSIVVNCAGIIRRLDIDAMGADDLDDLWRVNVRGTVAVTQLFLPQMIEQGYGKVINIGSLGSVQGLERRTAYATTKGAVAQYTVSLASEVGRHGIRANVIAPGYVDTDMAGKYIWGEPGQADRLLQRIPLGRFAAPDDLAGVFVFLAAAASDYITGQVLLVDGGWTAC